MVSTCSPPLLLCPPSSLLQPAHNLSPQLCLFSCPILSTVLFACLADRFFQDCTHLLPVPSPIPPDQVRSFSSSNLGTVCHLTRLFGGFASLRLLPPSSHSLVFFLSIPASPLSPSPSSSQPLSLPSFSSHLTLAASASGGGTSTLSAAAAPAVAVGESEGEEVGEEHEEAPPPELDRHLTLDMGLWSTLPGLRVLLVDVSIVILS